MDRFVEHLERLAGREADEFLSIDATAPGLPPVTVMVWHDFPEDGQLLAITYGLSAVSHEDAPLGRAELLLVVDSDDEEWAGCLGWIAEAQRGRLSFSDGTFLTTDAPISDDTEMTGFVLFAPVVLEPDDAAVRLTHYTVLLKQAYPIYAGEVAAIRGRGLEWFFGHPEHDPFSVDRRDLSASGAVGEA